MMSSYRFNTDLDRISKGTYQSMLEILSSRSHHRLPERTLSFPPGGELFAVLSDFLLTWQPADPGLGSTEGILWANPFREGTFQEQRQLAHGLMLGSNLERLAAATSAELTFILGFPMSSQKKQQAIQFGGHALTARFR
jgi:hypothetical protein